MPGIAGVVNNTDCDKLNGRMIETMHYFKQFAAYSQSFGSCAFSHVFLPSQTDDPSSDNYSKSGIFTLFNGNISNLDELKGICGNIHDDDREALILYKLYIKDQQKFYANIKGSFSYILYDSGKEIVYISNDRLGLNPVYYFTTGPALFFASEIKPLLATDSIKKSLDHKGCADFFAFGYVMQEDTLFEGIKLLPPASAIKYDLKKEKYKIINYYNIHEVKEKLRLSKNDIYDIITQKFDDSVKKCFGKEKLGFFLTAGVDSRANISSAANASDHLRTFTYGIKGCFDEIIADKLSKKLKTSHHFLGYDGGYLAKNAEKIIRMTDGMLNIFHTGGFPVYPKIAKIVDKMVVGDGGEFARGFYHSRKNLQSNGRTELLQNLYRDTATIFDFGKKITLFNDGFSKFMTNIPMLSLECALNRFKDFSINETLNMFYLHERVRKFGTLGFLLKRPYFKIACPFLDDDYIDILLQTPEELKGNSCAVHLNIIKRLNPELNKIIFEKTMLPLKSPRAFHFVGKQLVRLKKDLKKYTNIDFSIYKPYLMFDRWLRNELKEFVDEVLFSKRTEERGIYNVKNLKLYYEQHLSGKKDHSEQLCALMTFELFLRMYYD